MTPATSAPKSSKAWVISVNMGYGHERAAYALRDIAYDQVITANNYQGIPPADRELWNESRSFYEKISRMSVVPFVGRYLFEFYDRFQEIRPFYPRRDLSAPNVQVRELTYIIKRKKLAKHLIDKLRGKPLPLVTTFFLSAFAAEIFEYPGEIYCVICDADISRTWVPLDPKRSPIKYFAPNGRVVERLKLYGVPAENIYLTGFPLPKELIGGERGSVVKTNLIRRLNNLDPMGIFRGKYDRTLHQYLGRHWHPHSKIPRRNSGRPALTLTFSIGGAGSQRELGEEVLTSLRSHLVEGRLRLNLVAGTHREIRKSYLKLIRSLNLGQAMGRNLNVVYYETREDYFKGFSKLLSQTDILWTKPSELSFYAGLGLPIIMAPPIGSQEEFNALWLRTVGGGIPQNDPRHTAEWLFDWWQSGGLARMAWSGFVEAPTHGTYRIESIITGRKYNLARLPLIV